MDNKHGYNTRYRQEEAKKFRSHYKSPEITTNKSSNYIHPIESKGKNFIIMLRTFDWQIKLYSNC